MRTKSKSNTVTHSDRKLWRCRLKYISMIKRNLVQVSCTRLSTPTVRIQHDNLVVGRTTHFLPKLTHSDLRPLINSTPHWIDPLQPLDRILSLIVTSTLDLYEPSILGTLNTDLHPPPPPSPFLLLRVRSVNVLPHLTWGKWTSPTDLTVANPLFHLLSPHPNVHLLTVRVYM